MQIKRFVFNPFQVNTYVLYDETKEAIIIDAAMMTASEQSTFKQFIEENKLKIKGLYNTHGHMDHIAGSAWIKREYAIQPSGHKADDTLIETALSHAAVYGIEMEKPEAVSNYIDENNLLQFGNQRLKIKHIPGHSPGGLAFIHHTQKIAFTGDSLFASSIGRTDFPGGNMSQLISAIQEKLLSLDGEYTIYPGHGHESTIQEEIENNPYL